MSETGGYIGISANFVSSDPLIFRNVDFVVHTGGETFLPSEP